MVESLQHLHVDSQLAANELEKLGDRACNSIVINNK